MIDLAHALPRGLFLILAGVATGLCTVLGGVLALRFRSQIHLILGLSAGAVVAVALLDLLPEALEVGRSRYAPIDTMAIVGLGFLAYMAIDRVVAAATKGKTAHKGHLGAGSLTAHSFLDGVGIGFAFQVSAPVGVVVAAAVLAHDFSDGINTVNLSLAGNGGLKPARWWLAADALAPIAGIAMTGLLVVPRDVLAIALAVFTGFFLYIGASQLLPESHDRYPRLWTSAGTMAGFAFIYAAVRLAAL